MSSIHTVAVDEIVPKTGPKVLNKKRIAQPPGDTNLTLYDDVDLIPKYVALAMVQIAIQPLQAELVRIAGVLANQGVTPGANYSFDTWTAAIPFTYNGSNNKLKLAFVSKSVGETHLDTLHLNPFSDYHYDSSDSTIFIEPKLLTVGVTYMVITTYFR